MKVNVEVWDRCGGEDRCGGKGWVWSGDMGGCGSRVGLGMWD